jgi:hypothetical protein
MEVREAPAGILYMNAIHELAASLLTASPS